MPSLLQVSQFRSRHTSPPTSTTLNAMSMPIPTDTFPSPVCPPSTYADHNTTNTTSTDAIYAPEVYKPGSEQGDETYVLLMVDPDVTVNGQKTQLLQWLQPNLRGTPRLMRADATAQNATSNAGAFYYPPSPPAGSGRHYYTLILYRQPENWNPPTKYASFSPPANLTARLPFNITDFANSSGLTDAVASNYFWCENGTSSRFI